MWMLAFGLERDHDGVRRAGPLLRPGERAIQLGLVRLPVNDDQLSVQGVERAQPEVAVEQQLAQRDVAVERAVDQRMDGRGLKQLVGRLGEADPVVAQHLDVQRAQELEFAHPITLV